MAPMSTPRTVIRRHQDMIDERMDRFMDFLEGIVPNFIKMDFIWSALGVHEDVPWTPDGLRRAHELIIGSMHSVMQMMASTSSMTSLLHFSANMHLVSCMQACGHRAIQMHQSDARMWP